MKKKLLVIFMVSFTLTTIFGVSLIASADAIESIFVFVTDGNKHIRNAEVYGKSPDRSIYYESFLV